MKILVTGANGYLGRGIVNKLIEYGHDVIAVSRNDDNINKKAKIFKCDCFIIENPYVYFKKPDAVLHLAWEDGFKHMSNKHLENLYSHYEFIDKLVSSGLKKLSVMGSMHEIGFYEGSVNENTPCKPESYYGIAKNALRELCQLLNKQYDFILKWIRGFYIVGNSEHGCSIFSKLVQAHLKNEKTFPFTMGLNQFDFLDYDDFCSSVVKIVSQDKINGIINCCSGRPMKLSERVEKFIMDNQLDIKLKYGEFPDRPYDSKAIWGDDSKLKEIIKFYE